MSDWSYNHGWYIENVFLVLFWVIPFFSGIAGGMISYDDYKKLIGILLSLLFIMGLLSFILGSIEESQSDADYAGLGYFIVFFLAIVYFCIIPIGILIGKKLMNFKKD